MTSKVLNTISQDFLPLIEEADDECKTPIPIPKQNGAGSSKQMFNIDKENHLNFSEFANNKIPRIKDKKSFFFYLVNRCQLTYSIIACLSHAGVLTYNLIYKSNTFIVYGPPMLLCEYIPIWIFLIMKIKEGVSVDLRRQKKFWEPMGALITCLILVWKLIGAYILFLNPFQPIRYSYAIAYVVRSFGAPTKNTFMPDFQYLGLCPQLIEAALAEGWTLPTPIQDESIPLILGGSNVCAAAETGSGKTAAYGMPCLQLILEDLSITSKLTLLKHRKTSIKFKNTFEAISEDSQSKFWQGFRASLGVGNGVCMFEVEINSATFLRVGWGTKNCDVSNIGYDTESFGFGSTGKKSWNRTFEDYGEPFGTNDVIGCVLNCEKNSITFYKNGKYLGDAFKDCKIYSTPWFACVCGKGAFHVQIRFCDFVYPIDKVQPYAQSLYKNQKFSADKKGPLCVIFEPRKFLATQTFEVLTRFNKFIQTPSIKIALCVGNMSENLETILNANLVIAVAPRFFDLVKRCKNLIRDLRVFVLNEADLVFKTVGIEPFINFSKQISETQGYVQVVLFSATLSDAKLRSDIDLLTEDATWIDLNPKTNIPENINLACYTFDPDTMPDLNSNPVPTDWVHNVKVNFNKADYASYRSKVLKPQIAMTIANNLNLDPCLIFCRTNLDCDNLFKYLNKLGNIKQRGTSQQEMYSSNRYSCCVLAGYQKPQERCQSIQAFKEGQARFLICTDVASRGLDIQNLTAVIMMNVPDETDGFIHRVGRVGRAKSAGLAIALVSKKPEKVWYHTCPSRSCSNTNLKSNGGCCIYIDDSELLTKLQTELDITIPAMHPKTLAIDGIIEYTSPAENKPSDANSETIVTSGVWKTIDYGKNEISNRLEQKTLKFIEASSEKAKNLNDLQILLQRKYLQNLDLFK